MSEISTTPISANGEERRGETAASELSTGRALNGQEDNFVSGQTALDRDRKSGQKRKKYTKRRRVRVGKEAGRRGDDYRRAATGGNAFLTRLRRIDKRLLPAINSPAECGTVEKTRVHFGSFMQRETRLLSAALRA